MNCCPGLPGSNFLRYGSVTEEARGEGSPAIQGVFAKLCEKSTKTGEIIIFFIFSKSI